jgi:hypothetical protein
MGLILPDNSLTGQGLRQNCGCLVLVDFVLFQIDYIQVIFTEFLEMAKVFIADGMAFMKGGALELTGSNLGNVMGQFGADRIL